VSTWTSGKIDSYVLRVFTFRLDVYIKLLLLAIFDDTIERHLSMPELEDND